MKPIYYSILFLTIASVGCKKKQAFHLTAPIETIHFQTATAVDCSDLPPEAVKSRRFINLEMNKGENYVGFITKVSVLNNKIYVMDSRKRVLAIFDANGKHLGILERFHKDYLNMAYFDVDSSGTIYVIDGKLDNFLVYSPTLRLTNRMKSPFEIDIAQSLPNNTLLLGLSSWNQQQNAGDKILLASNYLKVSQSILPYDNYVDPNYWITNYRFVKSNTAIFYNRCIDNNVYVFSPVGALEKVVHFDFGPMNVPDADKKDIQKSMPRFANYRLLSDFTVTTKKYALGKIMDRRNFRFFYLNRVTNRLYLEDTSVTTPLKHFGDFDGKHLYSYIYPGEYDAHAFKGFPDSTKAHLQRGGIVLCEYELKVGDN